MTLRDTNPEYFPKDYQPPMLPCVSVSGKERHYHEVTWEGHCVWCGMVFVPVGDNNRNYQRRYRREGNRGNRRPIDGFGFSVF